MVTDLQGRKWLEGDGSWFFRAQVDGENLKVWDAKMTWFGVDDPEDNGLGAWGFHVAANPLFLGVALPLSMGPCHGSPLPRMSHNAHGLIVDDNGDPMQVRLYSHATGQTCGAYIVDLGPAKSTGHAIDGMPSVWKALGLENFREIGVTTVDYAILGAAHLAEVNG